MEILESENDRAFAAMVKSVGFPGPGHDIMGWHFLGREFGEANETFTWEGHLVCPVPLYAATIQGAPPGWGASAERLAVVVFEERECAAREFPLYAAVMGTMEDRPVCWFYGIPYKTVSAYFRLVAR